MPGIGRRILSQLNPLPQMRAGLRWLGTAEGRHNRRISVSKEGRAHIELRRAHHPDGATLGARAKKELERLEGVDWAEVDGVVGRVIIAFDGESLSAEDLVETIEAVEDLHDAADERFPHDRPDHPTDREPIQRNVFGIAADLAGIGVAATARTLKFIRIPSEVPGVISLIDSQPRVRRALERGLGVPATDVLVVSTNALAQALNQGPLGLLVDVAHRAGNIVEQRARRSVWERREPELVTGRASVGHSAEVVAERPVRPPKGPIESYADRASIASLGVFGAVVGVTRNPRRAADLLLAGIPKAATLGREAFSAQLDHALAKYGVISMDPEALRRLDRVDTLVLEADVVMSDTWSIDDLVAWEDAADIAQLILRTRGLFNPHEPHAVRTARSWRLGPLPDTGLPLPRGAKNRARMLGVGGRIVLGVWRGEELQALVSVQREPIPGGDDLVQAARDADLDVLLSGGNNAFVDRMGLDGRLVGSRLVDEIADLQRAGHVVMFVGCRQITALRTCDVGLGVERAGHRIPWGAHLVIGPDLENARRVVASIPTARAVSRRSALLALAGASTGGIWAFLGPSRSAAERTMLPVNGSALVSIGLGSIAGRQAGNRTVLRPAPIDPWHEMTPSDALERLESNSDGLSVSEQQRRRSATTARVAPEHVGLIRATIDELANPLTPLLGLGASMSAAVGSLTDATLVATVTGLNAVVGATQRVRTERALLRLEQAGEIPATVRVSGQTRTVPSDQVVVGDVIELVAGDVVPADCRLLEAVNVEVDESSITGESLPVHKSTDVTPGAAVAERTSMLFEGTALVTGSCVALVVAVGVDTEAGRSAAAAADPPPSGVEQRLSHLTRLTMPMSVVGGAAGTGLGFLYRRPARTAVGTGVSLMVAAIPEGLPALATMAQVAAARRLARHHALIRNPRAIEALGRADQMCFDKTGTLTQNSISLALVSVGGRDEPLDALSSEGVALLAAAQRATRTENGDQLLADATDQAILRAAKDAGITENHGFERWDRIDEIPYQSGRSYHAVLGHDGVTGQHVSLKGASEVVLPRCDRWRREGASEPIDQATLRQIEDHLDRLGRRGLRVLAVAEAQISSPEGFDTGVVPAGLELLGFIAFADLVRPSAAAALRDISSAGVNVAMITGDHVSTAEAIAAELGMLNGGRVLVGADLDRLADDELDAIISDVAVFARATPLHKVRIVEAYQRVGRSVVMAGDGANDAAAMRLADAGIAIGGRATASARAVADVVVTDDRIETIVDAIIEGRALWESVRSAVAILVGGNLGEIGFTLLGASLTGSAPLNPRQLLLVNLLTDLAPAIAIAVRRPPDRDPAQLLHEGPDASLGAALKRDITIRAATTGAGASAAWAMARLTGTPTRARTVALAALVGTQMGQTLVAGGPSPLVVGATAVSMGVLGVTIQTPGLSQFFGCRPLGPVGWTMAMSAAAGATGASVAVPWAIDKVTKRSASHGEGAPLVIHHASGHVIDLAATA